MSDLAEQVQVDLVVLNPDYAKDNDGYKYILMMIEILSRYAFAAPLKQKAGKVVAVSMNNVLQDFHDHFDEYPQLMQFDEGKEFLNKEVRQLLKQHDIQHFSTHSVRKASIVERLNRTIQTKLRKIFETQDTSKRPKEWVSHLADVIHNYNTQVNRSIGTTPANVTEANKFTIWGRLYGNVVRDVSKPKFHVGNVVRVANFTPALRGDTFQKHYKKKYPPQRHKKSCARQWHRHCSMGIFTTLKEKKKGC